MDIVERLRSPEVFITDGQMISPVAYEAAAKIENLRFAWDTAALECDRKNFEIKLLREELKNAYQNVFDDADEIKRLRKTLKKITKLNPFKFNTGHVTLQYITQMLVEMTALAHEALKEKE